MKVLVLAIAVGALGGLWLGERKPEPPDTWLAETVSALKRGDYERAGSLVDRRLEWDPADPAALALEKVVAHELSCSQALAEGEHALANSDRGRASAAFERVGSGCRQRAFAVTRLEQIGAR